MARHTKANTTDAFIRGIAFIIIGICVIIFSAKDFFNSFKEPVYLYDLKTEEITDGAYVQEYIYAALDYFMYEETTRSQYGVEVSSNISSYYYIVPVLTEDAEELYMAVEVGSADESAMNSVCDDTYAYLMGEMSEAAFGFNSHHVTGNIRDMEEEEIQYMVEWFQQSEYFGTTDAEEIKSYIYPVMLEKYNGSTARVMVILGAVFIAIGTFIMIHFSKVRRRQKAENESSTTYSTTYDNGYSQQDSYQTDNAYPSDNTYLNQQNDYFNQQ